jgi:hypothetical protein
MTSEKEKKTQTKLKKMFKNENLKTNPTKIKVNMHVLTFKTRVIGHKTEIDNVEGKPKTKQRSIILNKKMLRHESEKNI